jgi:hypothetical protein
MKYYCSTKKIGQGLAAGRAPEERTESGGGGATGGGNGAMGGYGEGLRDRHARWSDGRQRQRWNLQGREESELLQQRRNLQRRRTGNFTCGAMSGTAAVGRRHQIACRRRSCFHANVLSSFAIWGEWGGRSSQLYMSGSLVFMPLIRLQRIYNFWCSMLVFTPFAYYFVTLCGTFMHFPELTY